ncbi:hypothetical protein HTZ77_18710 [Nonomuraea sp. SMC257]|uniref:Uncharacterized protein n=1 Tax=Nonomuraea montanisoli TaxID=2741721 RepID=A0A7Y6I9Q3_9ACTN|nr:hypothetical protein [Nonomuraea montanisoli]NUW33445.1 hypothetical protein [Nonomuraea montanisoli]
MRRSLPLLLAMVVVGLTACVSARAPAVPSPAPSPTAKIFTPDPAMACGRKDSPAATPPPMTEEEGWRMAVAFNDGDPADVAATRDGQVWVVGGRQMDCHHTYPDSFSGAIWRYDGQAWGSVPGPACAVNLVRVLATREGAVWVLGEGRKSECVARWNGTGWTEESRPKDVMAAVGTDGLWLRKGSGLVRWSDGSARRYELGMTPQLVSVRGANEAWATGFRRSEDKEPDEYTAAENVPHFARWDGRAWHPIPSPKLDLPQDARRSWVDLTDQFAAGPDDVWAVGRVGSDIPAPDCTPVEDDTCDTARLLILHWDGAAWSQRLGKPVERNIGDQMAPDGSGGFWLPESDGDMLTHLAQGRLAPVHLPGDFAQLIAITAQPDSTRTWLLGWAGENPPDWVLWSTG